MLVNKEKDIVQCATVLACELHKGQVDKAGVDYFTGHLTAVAKKGNTWQQQVVGYLHDASEDTPHSVEEVLNLLDEKLGTPLSVSDKGVPNFASNKLSTSSTECGVSSLASCR